MDWIALVVSLANQEVEEGVVAGSHSSILVLLGSLLLFSHFSLVHSKVNVEKAESDNDEGDEKVNDLESQVSLGIKVIPFLLVLGRVEYGLLTCFLG